LQKRSILVQFLRHSGFWLTTSDDVNMVIDPILSSSYKGQELIPPPFEPTAIEKVYHFDAETINGIRGRTGANVIAPLDVINKLNLPRWFENLARGSEGMAGERTWLPTSS